MLLLTLLACVINGDHYRDIIDVISTGDRDGDGSADAGEGGDDCDDLDPGVHPDADETWEDGLTDNDCDEVLEDIEVAYGADALTGEASGSNAGRRLGIAGDIDGDGLDEVLVGAWSDGTLFERGGAAYVVMAATDGALSQHPALRPSGAGWYLGCALDGGPDLDGDGAPDVIVGALGYDDSAGAAWLVSGTDWASGELTLPDDAMVSIVGETAGDVAGGSARFLGDVTGDGVADAAVSAQLADVGGLMDAGLVGVFTADELDTVTLTDAPLQIYGTYTEAYIGATLAGVGDQDGDGLDDYLISAESGLLAAVLPGGLEAPELEGDALFRLTAASGDIAESVEVRMVGDIDGDGTRDLAVVPLFAGDEALAPQVLFYTALAGSPTRTTEFPSAIIDVGEGSYLFDVTDAGDLDEDGRAETLVPIQGYAPEASSALAIHRGITLDFNTTIDVFDTPLVGVSVRPTAAFGYRALVTSDVDGDGAGEIVLGGYADDEGGEDAGAVTFLALPQ